MSRLTFDQIANMTVGDRFYESEYGLNIWAEIESLPFIKEVEMGGTIGPRRQITFQALNVGTDGYIDYMITEGMEHYGCKLYLEPEMIVIRNDGEFGYIEAKVDGFEEPMLLSKFTR